MSKIEELIQRYCPDGVEYVKLDEMGNFYSGLSGKSKDDFRDGNAKFITYVNIFNNPALNTDVDDKVKITDGEKQNTIQYGDLLFTGSSETPDECGMCSVLTHHTDENLYLNSFCFGFRFNDLSDKCPSFMKHLFRSTSIRKKICKTANGVTRYNISKKEFAKLEIPLPPLPVQEAIVNILDRFTEYTAELQAELQARQQQYNYYRDTLLSFEGREDVEWKKLGEVAKVCRGTRVVKSQLSDDGFPVYQNCLTPMGYFDKTNCPGGTPFVICGGAAGNVGYADVECWAADDCEYIIAGEKICSRYIYHSLMVKKEYLTSKVRKASIPRLSPNVIKELETPIPPLSEQQRIVDILDRFDTLVHDLSQGLPAEIEARRQQYEYYRDKLLNFTKCRS